MLHRLPAAALLTSILLCPGTPSAQDDDSADHDVVEDCNDDIDNDGDGMVDFEDRDCLLLAEQQSGFICDCDYPDPPDMAGRRAILPVLAGLGVCLGLRRRVLR